MNAQVRSLLVFLAALCLAPALAHADIPVSIPSIKDMTIYGTANGAADLGSPPHNAGANADMLVGSVGRCGIADQGARRRGLIAFDIGQIPTGSTVISAQLKLFLTVVALENTQSHISVSRISNGYPWTESTNAGGAWPGQPAINGDAAWCWLSYPFVTWPCGGPTDRVSDTSPVLLSTGVITWSGANILNDVQEWVNGTHQNNGWLLTNSIEGTFTVAPPNADATTRRFGSREAPAVNQPVLAVSYKLKQGSSGCGSNDQCATGFCTNGVCCNVAACPAAQACNSSAPVCQAGSGVCSNPLLSSGVCRPAAGVCDVPESCNGSSQFCPADAKSAAVCRPSAGVCDPAESCDNVNNNCPTDKKSTAVCRPSAGVCDPAESCDNVSNACPADAKSTAVCRPSAGVCDPVESCDNVNNACPADGKSTAVCRPSAGVCDPAESCDNVNNACPADGKSTAVCRPSAGVCDPAESCDNVSNACPADSKSTAVCRPSAGACDPAESCDNVSNNCPADAKSSQVCRPAAGVCDVPESCAGGNACPADTKVTLDTPCADDGNVCTADKCDGVSPLCQHPAGNLGSVCRPTTGVCDPAEACNGSSASCPADVKSSAVCRPSAGVCDVAESCDGVSGGCPADGKSTAVCRPSGGICDVTESCDGTNVNCPGDGFVANTQQCRAPSCAAGTETLAANCTGTGPLCPSVSQQSCAPLSCSGTACGGNCTGDQDCSGGLHCVDQICCNTTCGNGDPSDCQACNVPGHLGTCFASPTTYACRASAGICDKADTCDGTSLACPVDGKQSVTTVCRGSAGACDLDDKCDGLANTCPADAKAPVTQVCRVAAGPCDVDDKCNGTTNTCPADLKAGLSQICRPSAGPCDVDDKCDGTTNACPTDVKVAANQSCPDDGSICSTDKCDGVSNACQHVPGNAGVQCRMANGSACDVADFCTGTTAACVDGKQSSSTVCRPVAGECDLADTCDGTNDACPADTKATAGSGCSDDGNPCTTDKCTGASVTCQHAAGNAGVQCRAANGSACDVADTCDGATTTCADAKAAITFICRPSAGECDAPDTCTGTADACPADKKSAAGSPCTDDGLPCTTDRCDAASPLCQHVAGNPGTVCRPATAGACDAPESCDGTHASCPGDGYLGPTTQCQASTCSGGVESVAANCTGTGPACPASTTKPCGAFACGPTACLTTCTTDVDCSPGNFCGAGGKCLGKNPPGAVCTTNGSCLSSFCADGVCCKDDCSGQCEACNVSGKAGTCSPVTGPPAGSRAQCSGDGTACKGTCDGINTQSCSFPGSTTQCRAASCQNGNATLTEFCTGSGSCPPPRLQSCGAAVCGPTQCQGCSTDGECPMGKFCRGGVCNPLATVGTSCSRDGECAGGHCVDTVCCDSDCVGQCETCDDPGKPGTCMAISGVPRNRPACNGVGGGCAGTCDATNGRTCTYPGFGVVCHDAACANDVAAPPVFCDGNGNCPAPVPQPCPAGSSCSGVLCSGGSNTCTGTCSVLGTYCSSGVCVPEKDLGAHCNSPTECASSFCVDGVCCSAACSGQCEACDVSGTGTCTPVPANTAPHGSRRACASDGSTCAGRCDGIKTDRCGYAGNNQSCRPGSCANGIATLDTGCQGDGTCGPFQQQDCGGETCDVGGIVCAKGCRFDVDCKTGEFCSGGVCLAKRAAGAACGSSAQCALGNCVDHVCCDTPCDGQCESCNQPDNPGTCLPVAGVPRGGRPACSGSSACGGFCDGTNGAACRLPGSSTSCGVPLCENGAVSAGATCANTICVPAIPESCEPYVCDPAGQSCLGDCSANEDCARDSICLPDGHCGSPVPDGGTNPGPDASISAGGAGGRPLVDAGAGGAAAGTGGGGGGGATQGRGGASGALTDAGAPPRDGGARDGGSGASSGDKGSCGCRVPGGRSTPGNAPFSIAVAAGVLLVLRRKRRARPAIVSICRAKYVRSRPSSS